MLAQAHSGCVVSKKSPFPVASSEPDLCFSAEIFHSSSAKLLKSGNGIWLEVFCVLHPVYADIRTHTRTHTQRNTQEGNALNSVLLCQHFFHCERLQTYFSEGVFACQCVCASAHMCKMHSLQYARDSFPCLQHVCQGLVYCGTMVL